MGQNQSKQPPDGERAPARLWRTTGPLIVAGLSAHVTVVVLTKSAPPEPLLTALVATLVFAAVNFVCNLRQRAITASTAQPAVLQLLTGGLAAVAIGVGAWLTSHLFGTGGKFYCEPLVPWRIEIALFGSFAFAYLISAARERGWLVYPLVLVGFLWIAPFYGFFSAPIFLGISLNTVCPNRSAITVVLAALAMLVADRGGTILGLHLSRRSERRD